MVGPPERIDFAQVAGVHAAVRRDLDRGDVRVDGAQPITFGRSQQFLRARRRSRDSRVGERGRPVAAGATVDHGAVTQPVGGHHHRSGDLELLLQR